MSGFKPSPGAAAKVLAKRVPDFVGMLRIDGLTPGGRGGWMTKSKWSRFWIVRGEAYAARSSFRRAPTNTGFRAASNGPCAICGEYNKVPDRSLAFAPDPRAGEEIGRDRDTLGVGSRADETVPVLLAEFATVTACPSCIAAHGLVLNEKFYNFYRSVWEGGKRVAYVKTRLHPLSTYSPPVLQADIRPVHDGRVDLASVEVKPYETPEPTWENLMRV
jgi:hypothetical protein